MFFVVVSDGFLFLLLYYLLVSSCWNVSNVFVLAWLSTDLFTPFFPFFLRFSFELSVLSSSFKKKKTYNKNKQIKEKLTPS